MVKLDSLGREVISDERVEIPARLRRPDTIAEQIQRTIRQELSSMASNSGFESFDEADDFDVGDDDPRSIHELDDDQLEYDIRDDPRYQRSNVAAPEPIGEGVTKGEQGVRRNGISSDKDHEGDKPDQRPSGQADDKQ